MPRVGIEANVSLLVAAFDLKVVQLLRQAIRTADISSGKGQPVAGLGPAPSTATTEPRLHFHPTPYYEPRPHLHPTPFYEPRPILHCRPIEECPCVPIPTDPIKSNITKSPIEPPWKVLPWQNPLPLRPKLKVVIKRPDVVSKGVLFDAFV